MNQSIHHILGALIPLGSLGLFLLAFADDSFLFLPVGSDLLAVILIARSHPQFLICVPAAAAGSMAGVFVLDLICRKGGEAGLTRFVKPRQLDQLKRRMEKHGTLALIVACISPPPFPFGAYVAAASALQYPKPRLLTLVFCVRFIRYALVGWAAIHWGRSILKAANSQTFLWIMGFFIAFCLIGSVISVVQWVRLSRRA